MCVRERERERERECVSVCVCVRECVSVCVSIGGEGLTVLIATGFLRFSGKAICQTAVCVLREAVKGHRQTILLTFDFNNLITKEIISFIFSSAAPGVHSQSPHAKRPDRLN